MRGELHGDKLASGARSAQFSVAPNMKFDEGVMRDDFKLLTQEDFTTKYMITPREYDLMRFGGDERVSHFAEEMRERAALYERELAADAKQEATLARDCFLTPYVPLGVAGRVIVTQDVPTKPNSKLALPKSLRKSRDLLPTTGHVIRAVMYNDHGVDVSDQLLGRRVVFSPMSGTAICFKNYPTWRQLELSEILATVDKEDVVIIEEELESMV